MTNVVSRREFSGVIDRDSGAAVTGLLLEECTFHRCVLSFGTDPARRTSIDQVTLRRCRSDDSRIYAPRLVDVTVEDLETSEHGLFVSGAVFKHVTLTGHLGTVSIDGRAAALQVPARAAEAFSEANRAFYEEVDWALDIRHCTSDSLSILGVPARLVRRDPSRQLAVYRDRLERDSRWVAACEGTWWGGPIQNMLLSPYQDAVLVSPGRTLPAPYARAIAQLTELGFTEPADG